MLNLRHDNFGITQQCPVNITNFEITGLLVISNQTL